MLSIPHRTVFRSIGPARSIALTLDSTGSSIAAGLPAARPWLSSNVLPMRFRNVLCCRFPCRIRVWLMPLIPQRTNSAMSLSDPVARHGHHPHLLNAGRLPMASSVPAVVGGGLVSASDVERYVAVAHPHGSR